MTKTQAQPQQGHNVLRKISNVRKFLAEAGADQADDPDLYILTADGDCFLPDVAAGNQMVISPNARPQRGDLAVIWHREKQIAPMLKRLTMALPEIEKIHPDSEVMPVIVCEQINPMRLIAVPVDKVSAVHKVVAQLSVSVQAGWQEDGLYAYEWSNGNMFLDRVKVRTKKGTIRKEPIGVVRYGSGDKVRSVTVRTW